MFGRTVFAVTGFGLLASAGPTAKSPPTQDASQLYTDPLTYGPELELVHLYYDEFPTGMALLMNWWWTQANDDKALLSPLPDDSSQTTLPDLMRTTPIMEGTENIPLQSYSRTTQVSAKFQWLHEAAAASAVLP